MSGPSGSGAQELVPVGQYSTQLTLMEVSGAKQMMPGVAPRVEEPTEGSRVSDATDRQSQEPKPVVVDQRVFVHAPQYH